MSASPSQPDEPEAPRRKGRPRDSSADERILAAAAQLILTRGFDNMTVDEVAAMAKAGKATVYRRWAGKEDLAFAALEQLYTTQLPIPDTGNVRDDLVLATRMALEFSGSETGRAYMRMTCAESLRDSRIGALSAVRAPCSCQESCRPTWRPSAPAVTRRTMKPRCTRCTATEAATETACSNDDAAPVPRWA